MHDPDVGDVDLGGNVLKASERILSIAERQEPWGPAQTARRRQLRLVDANFPQGDMRDFTLAIEGEFERCTTALKRSQGVELLFS